MAKAAVFLAEGFEEIEGLTVVDLLRRAEISVDIVSTTGEEKVTGAHGICVKSDCLFEAVDFETLDMIVLPGGMPGTLNLLKHEALVEKVKEFNEQGKLLAAICAAPMILGKAGTLNGKKAVCYPGNEKHLEGAKVLYEDVAIDANVITSRGLGTAISFSLAVITHFCGSEKAKEIQKAILF